MSSPLTLREAPATRALRRERPQVGLEWASGDTRYRWPMSEIAPRIKVCGITRLQDAELAVELGAWAVGMVFYEPSPRACSMEEALRIATALRRKVEVCGVFVNEPLDEVVRIGEELGLTLLQLHGDEGPAYCAEAGHRTGARVVKAAQVSTIGEVRDVERFHTDFHLLDARSATPGREGLRGGTGETFDWSLLAARRSKVPLILSGGLGPENAVEAIRAASEQGHRARPFAIDTASGTEAAPGHKDPERLRALFDAVRGATSEVPDRPSDMPAPASASSDMPAPASASSDMPAPASASSDMPAPASASSDMPAPASASSDAPAPASAGMSV